MIKVSLIIPVFNAADFLSACIQSALEQSLSEIEVIVVNDGSVDSSHEKLKNFMKADQRIKLIYQQNKGVSSARNLGLDIAKGEWIAFADADDVLEHDMLATLYQNAISQKAGMVVCNVWQHSANNAPKKRLALSNELLQFKHKPEKAVAEMMKFSFDYANWNKLYRADIIQQQQIRFDEHICIGEDLLFNLYYLHYIDSIACVDAALYHYKLHEHSVMAKSAAKRMEEFNRQFKAYKNFTRRHSLQKEWECFRRYMAKGFYNTQVPLLIKYIKSQKLTKAASIKAFSSCIAGMDADMFYFPEKKWGLQGIKKTLLEKRKYNLFAKLIGLKHF